MKHCSTLVISSFILIVVFFGDLDAQTTTPKKSSAQTNTQEQEKPAVDPKHLEAAVRALIAACDDENTSVRVASIRLLGQSKVLSQDVANKLKDCLFDQDEQVALMAVQSFSQLQCDSSIKLKILIQLLDSDNQKQVEVAGQLLYSLPVDKKSVLAVAEFLKDKNTSRAVKRQLFGVLQSWGMDAAPAMNVLSEMYAANDQWKIQILTTLRSIGSDAKPAIPTITKAIRDKEANVRLLAVETLESVLSDRTTRRSSSGSRYGAYAKGLIDRYDTNRDRVISAAEGKALRQFLLYDRNRDGRLTEREIINYLNLTTQRARTRTTTSRPPGRR